MPLKPYVDESSVSLIISVHNDGSPDQVLQDLNDALIHIKDGLAQRHYCFPIDVGGTWTPGDPEFDPFDDQHVAAWGKIVSDPEMQDGLLAWLKRCAALIKETNDTYFTCLAESDEMQFAEVPASSLAMLDARFLPVFVELMEAWDLDHAVSQFDVAESLIERYGTTSETTKLQEILAEYA